MSKHAPALLSAMAKRRVFITGGSGFVGRNLIRHYRHAGADVLALVRSNTAEHTVRALGAVPVHGELFDPHLADAMRGCDLLIHAAADTSHAYPSTRQWQVNVEGTQQIFRAAREAGIARAVHISTESVLLTGKPLHHAEETMPLPAHFAGAYSHSKAEAEQVALAHAGDHLAVMVIRPRFVWGKDDTTALPQLIAAVNSQKFAWIGGGGYLTSTTHIDNLCDGISRAAEYGSSREIYFISDGPPLRFRDFVSRLLATQRITAPDKSVPRGVIKVLAHLGDLAFRLSRGRLKSPLNLQVFATSAVEVSLNTEKARAALNYVPVTSVEQGMMELMK